MYSDNLELTTTFCKYLPTFNIIDLYVSGRTFCKTIFSKTF